MLFLGLVRTAPMSWTHTETRQGTLAGVCCYEFYLDVSCFYLLIFAHWYVITQSASCFVCFFTNFYVWLHLLLFRQIPQVVRMSDREFSFWQLLLNWAQNLAQFNCPLLFGLRWTSPSWSRTAASSAAVKATAPWGAPTPPATRTRSVCSLTGCSSASATTISSGTVWNAVVSTFRISNWNCHVGIRTRLKNGFHKRLLVRTSDLVPQAFGFGACCKSELDAPVNNLLCSFSNVVSPCAAEPCRNGGTCQVEEDLSFSCVCPRGWIGNTCTQSKTVSLFSSSLRCV